MRRGQFPVSSLPAWCGLNDVTFYDVEVAKVEDRGYGLVAERDLFNEDDNVEIPTLLTIPKDLVLCTEAVEEHARENKDFRQLLDVAGRQSARGDILLFLMAQLVLSSPDYTSGQGASTPWSQYFSLLPTDVPVPTMWTESELSLLRGTSLETAVAAKLAALTKEFDVIRAKTENIPQWYELLSIDEEITVSDWILLDALYRSRSLGLPKSGESMVPCLDLVNHSNSATAYFEETGKDEVALLLRSGSKVPQGSEVTIDYGTDKSAAEMLFSYGFIDEQSAAKSMVLRLESMDDDPLSKAKLHVFGAPPVLEIKDTDSGVPQWSAPFAYLMCLNQEDGLDFRVLQETDGTRHLRMFWQDIDITDQSDTIKDRIDKHELRQVFQLRTVMVVLEVLNQRISGIVASETIPGLARASVWHAAAHLKRVESELLERTLQELENQKDQLLVDDSVVAYLGAMEAFPNESNDAGAPNENEDFS